MFGKIIGVIILIVMTYNFYRIYERGKIRAELQKNNRRKITHNEIVEEQKRRDNQRIIEQARKYQEEKQRVEALKKEEEIYNQVFEKNLGIKKQSNGWKKFTAEEWKEWNKRKKEIGDLYEAFIAEHYRSLGYDVIERGKNLGVKDKGIDLIATKDEELLLIQCKNWAINNKIEKKHLSEFVGDVTVYLEKYQNLNYEKLRRIYVMSNQSLHGSAKHYLRENENLIECFHIPIKEEELNLN